MLVIFIKLILLYAFGAIFYQDLMERKVFWFLFPILGACAGILFFFDTLPELFLASISINLISIAILFFGVYLYAKFKLQTSINKVIGLGDLLFLLAIALGFSSVSFLVLLPCAFIFSLLIHLAVKNKNHTSVPLAGYLSLFYGITFLGYWSGIIHSLYQI